MDQLDKLREIAKNADRLYDELWLIRDPLKIKNTDDRLEHLAKNIQDFCKRLSSQVETLVNGEHDRVRDEERKRQNERQLSFFGKDMATPAEPAKGPLSWLQRWTWWQRSSVAAGASALLTLAAVNAFKPADPAYASTAATPVAANDMVYKGLSDREWEALPGNRSEANADDR